MDTAPTLGEPFVIEAVRGRVRVEPSRKISGLVGFCNERAEIFVDVVLQERPGSRVG